MIRECIKRKQQLTVALGCVRTVTPGRQRDTGINTSGCCIFIGCREQDESWKTKNKSSILYHSQNAACSANTAGASPAAADRRAHTHAHRRRLEGLVARALHAARCGCGVAVGGRGGTVADAAATAAAARGQPALDAVAKQKVDDERTGAQDQEEEGQTDSSTCMCVRARETYIQTDRDSDTYRRWCSQPAIRRCRTSSQRRPICTPTVSAQPMTQ